MSPPDPSATPDWEALYDDAPCGLLLTAQDGTIRLANRTFCRLVGIERDALAGKRRFQDLLSMGGRIFHQTHWGPLLQMQGSLTEIKLDLLHRDGHQIPMIMNAVRRERSGVVLHEISLFRAEERHAYERELMHARKRAEQLLAAQRKAQLALELAEARLRMAMESADLYIWEVDPLTGERHYDPRVALLLGLDAPENVDSARYLSAVDPADRERESLALQRMLDGSANLHRVTYRLNGADGRQRTVLATAREVGEVGDGGGSMRRIVGLLQDITELSQQRIAAEDRALFAEQMIGIVSHDLRNPLSTIKLGVELLAMSAPAPAPAPAQEQMLGRIDRAVAHALTLTDDLLDFTMARLGKGIAVEVQPIDLHALVAGHVEELALAHPSRVLVHERVGDGDCALDPGRLFQVIGNLVSNALTYGGSGSPVTVTSRVGPAQCSIAVRNLGPAIPEALLPKLFQPMVRGAGQGGANRSVGLGLYIVSEIARAHRGEVRVTSSEAGGTTFTVTFPQLGPAPGSNAGPLP